MKSVSKFFMPCCDGSVNFEFLKKALYQMPLFIKMLVVIPLIQAIGPRWYNRNLPVAGRKVQNSLSVIAFVRDKVCAFQAT